MHEKGEGKRGVTNYRDSLFPLIVVVAFILSTQTCKVIVFFLRFFRKNKTHVSVLFFYFYTAFDILTILINIFFTRKYLSSLMCLNLFKKR